MRNKKHLLLFVGIFIIVYLISVFSVFAHPGRTDQNGGHWDRENGTYHFHTGEYAGRSSSGGSSNSEYVPFTPPYEPPNDNPYRNGKAESSANNDDTISLKSILIVTFLFWISATSIYDFFNSNYYHNRSVYAVIGIGFGIMLVVYCLDARLFTIKALAATGIVGFVLFLFLYSYYVFLHLVFEKHLPSYKINLLQEKIDKLQCIQDKIEALNREIFDFKTRYQIPDLYEIGTDNLPKDKNSILHWGKSFTLYRANNGTKLHTKYNCCSATNPFHIYHCRHYSNFSKLLCKKCAIDYVVPDMSWYKDYLKCKQVISEQQRTEDYCNKLQKEINNLHKKCNSISIKILIMLSKKNRKVLQEVNNKYAEMQMGKQLSLFDYIENEVNK